MGLFGKFGELFDYNYEQLNEVRDVINNLAGRTRNMIAEKLYHYVVVPISNVWYAPEAVEFFKDFSFIVKQSGENITEIFDDFRGEVELSGKNFAKNSGAK